MNLKTIPLFEELSNSRSILLSGCGGGFDVFGALPLYFALRDAGKRVHLANFSFSFPELGFPLAMLQPEYARRRIAKTLLSVDADLQPTGSYFPELYLSRWFRDRGEEVPVYTFATSGVAPLLEGYRVLADRLGLDAVVLVDGGSDSLMRGDEEDLATPSEDIASIAAVSALELPIKMLTCVGFGIDWYHGLCHARVLEATAELAAAGGFLGIFSLLPGMPEAELFRQACSYVFDRMPGEESTVASSVISALDGRFGNWHSYPRTRKGELWISPLMSAYWSYRLDAVASRLLYPLDALRRTQGIMDVTRTILDHRKGLGKLRPRISIPI
jgi:hypothetical protein